MEKKTASTSEKTTVFERLRSVVGSERANAFVISAGGFLCLAPSILAVTGIDSLVPEKFKGIALPLLLISAAVAVGFYIAKSKGD